MTEPTVSELTSEHESLVRELTPTLARYVELGGRAVELQRDIFRKLLCEAYPGMTYEVVPRVITISAREKLPSLHAALKALADSGVTPTRTLFDPVRDEFHIFSSQPPKE